MPNNENNIFLNYILSMMLSKVVVPSEYHDQVNAINSMLEDDVSGLVDSLTDFAVDSASVDFNIETSNEDLNVILREWLDNINIGYNGKIPVGINPLAEEYYKELFKNGSFPVLKIAEWTEKNNIILPTKMFFVDGGSIYAKDIDKSSDLTLESYEYYLNDINNEKNKLRNNCIFAPTSGRWYDKYPKPYLIRRGIYHNWKIIQSIKNNETKVLDQIIPYMLLILKGSPELASQQIKSYSNEELTEIIEEFKALMKKVNTQTVGEGNTKTPVRATNFDEQIKHLIPDLSSIFNPQLFTVAEKNILSGLGFIDIAEAVSSSRRESILNPKAFITTTKKAVSNFKQVIKHLVLLIKDKNKEHRKYMNADFHITNSPINSFMTAEFKDHIRQLYDRGRVSSQTAVELIAEVDFETEVMRREKETKRGIEKKLYPVVTRNQENTINDLPKTKQDTDEEDISDDKKDEIEKQEYDIESQSKVIKCECIKCGHKVSSNKHCKDFKCPKCKGEMRRINRPGKGRLNLPPNVKGKKLIKAPYNNINQLPKNIKENMSESLQQTFITVFNKAYKQYNSEEKAFQVAWSAIKKIAKKNKNGIWVKKSSRAKLGDNKINRIIKNNYKKGDKNGNN